MAKKKAEEKEVKKEPGLQDEYDLLQNTLALALKRKGGNIAFRRLQRAVCECAGVIAGEMENED